MKQHRIRQQRDNIYVKSYLRDRDGIEVYRANFDLLEQEVELWASWSRLATKSQRVAI